MSRSYDTVEPSVIDEALLKLCVEDQGPKGEAGKIAQKEGIDFKDVKELRLDFKNILKIDNLWQFTNLVKLQLDNNFIEKINGLESLINLQWLDLSFNNIEVIEGLDSLTQLKDVTFFNNRITSVGNMDLLTELQILSIGNNQLESLSDLIYLRRFEKLNTLTLSGNPFCKLEEYYKYTIAHLPSLVYVDYRLIDNVKREEAIEFYRDSIDELVHDEAIFKRKKAEEEEKASQRAIHKDAYVEDLDNPTLFDSLFDEDPEASKLAQLPGVEDLLLSYKEQFTAVCLKLFEFGLKDRLKRKDEIDAFFAALYDAIKHNLDESVRPIQSFEKEKSKVYAELVNCTVQEVAEKRISELSDSITSLWDILMGLEMQLVDQLEESIKDFERNMSDMVGSFVESVQEFISQLRTLETNHHEKLSDIAVVTLEKLMKNELEEEMSEDVRVLFVDKDTIVNAVSASHDAHTFRIDNKEDDIVTRANTYVQTLVEKIHSDEIKRNRSRVTEINTLLDHYREELENFENSLGL